MNKKTFALIISAGLLAGPAFAASVTETGMHKFKVRGKMVEVHEMKMDNGTVVYAMSRTDLERYLQRRLQDFSNYSPQ